MDKHVSAALFPRLHRNGVVRAAAGREPITFRTFALVLAVLLAFCLLKQPQLGGDADEYVAMTVALASHGTPDVRRGDIPAARLLAHDRADHYDRLEAGMSTQDAMPKPGYYRGRDGSVQAIHFFGYSALAALPYRFMQAVGANPLKGYLIVNLTAIWLLGLAMFRFFGNAPRAFFGLALFVLTGAKLYWNHTSPELLSAASLLAAFLWFGARMPIAGGLQAGLAAMQNPTIVFAFAFLPFVALILNPPPREQWLRQALALLLAPRMLAGLAAGVLIASLAPLYNLYQFGVPSIIASQSTRFALISLHRMESLFLDLNQGMLLAVPGIALMLAVWGWRRDAWRRQLSLFALCAGTMLALTVPALAVVNWNSGAAGLMRYAFWAAMPLLFVLLARLRDAAAWPRIALAVLLLAQWGSMKLVTGYGHLEFSPLARWAMSNHPQIYNPELELFIERLMGAEDVDNKDLFYQWKNKDGAATKTLYYRGPNSIDPGEKLCGPGQIVLGDQPPVAADRNWAYLNGPLHCTPARTTDLEQALQSGWNAPDRRDGKAVGAWAHSTGSSLDFRLDGKPARYIRLSGDYLPTATPRSRVVINGKDMGWHNLRYLTDFPLPSISTARDAIHIELTHEAAAGAEPLTFYLLSVKLI